MTQKLTDIKLGRPKWQSALLVGPGSALGPHYIRALRMLELDQVQGSECWAGHQVGLVKNKAQTWACQ